MYNVTVMQDKQKNKDNTLVYGNICSKINHENCWFVDAGQCLFLKQWHMKEQTTESCG